jgi:hypothetical protein
MKILAALTVLVCLSVGGPLCGATYTDEADFMAALGYVETIDFEGIATAGGQAGAVALTGAEFSPPVTLTATEGGLFVGMPDATISLDNLINFFAFNFYPTSGVACFSPENYPVGAPDGVLRVDFDDPVGGVGAYILDADIRTSAYVEAFDEGGSSLGTLMRAELPPGEADGSQAFVGIVSASNNIAYAVFDLGTSGDGVGLDDLSYGFLCTPVDLESLTAEPLAVPLGTCASFEGVFAGGCATVVADWGFGDGNSNSQSDAASPCAASNTFATAGVYNVTLTLTDAAGNTDSETIVVVVYDASGGFVTGGGWIYSDAGNYRPDPSLEGKANFGFVSKYKKGANVPTGNTEFQFKAGDLNFHSSSYQWLVVTGSNYAKFKGTGTINGSGGEYGDYKFMIWAGDDAPDTFRIKIWEEDVFGLETVVYDNGFDQAIGGGSIVVHAK